MKKRINGAVAGVSAGLLGAAGAAGVAAQTRLQDKFFPSASGPQDVVSAGNGGVSTASANGGAVGIGDVNSGGNAGSAIGIGDTSGGGVSANGGTMTNTTDLGVTANGGTAIADASGGNYNLAFVS
jgi:hypothetical protein